MLILINPETSYLGLRYETFSLSDMCIHIVGTMYAFEVLAVACRLLNYFSKCVIDIWFTWFDSLIISCGYFRFWMGRIGQEGEYQLIIFPWYMLEIPTLEI